MDNPVVLFVALLAIVVGGAVFLLLLPLYGICLLAFLIFSIIVSIFDKS